MPKNKFVAKLSNPGPTRRWVRVAVLAIVVGLLMIFITGASPARRGATQISGVGFFADTEVECQDIPLDPEGEGPHFALVMTGDLEGCMYVFVETAECSPSGTYRETGIETYYITGGAFGEGYFETSYRATAKFDGCPLDDPTVPEIHGRCQHPIIPGSGDGVFTGVLGRLDFKDDVSGEIFRAPYRGHMRW